VNDVHNAASDRQARFDPSLEFVGEGNSGQTPRDGMRRGSMAALSLASSASAAVTAMRLGKKVDDDDHKTRAIERRLSRSVHVVDTDARKFSRNINMLDDKLVDAAVLNALHADANVGRWVIPVSSPFRSYWDIVILLLVMYEIAIVPYTFAFQDLIGRWPDYLDVVDHLVYACFCADLVLNFFTSYYVGEKEITSHCEIARRYVSSHWFWVDLVSLMPAEFVDTDHTSLLKGLKLFRLVRVGKILKRMDDLMFASAFRMMRLLVFIGYNVHWGACLWQGVMGQEFALMLNIAEEQVDDTRKVVFVDLFTVYTSCLWCSISFLLGLGALNPITNSETYVASVLSIYGACLQACVFGSVAVLIAGLDAEESRFQRKVAEVSQRMRLMSLPDGLRKRVTAYYNMMWRLNLSGSTNVDSFINELSPSLQIDIRLCLFRDMLTKIPFFADENLNPLLLEALVTRLKAAVYLPGDVIMRKGEKGDWMGFVGRGGKVAIIDPTTDPDERRIIKILQEGDYVGEIALLFNTRRTADVEAFTLVRMHMLTSKDYRAVRQLYPSDARVLTNGIKRFLVAHRNYTETDLEELREQAHRESEVYESS
jgi:CRP-like cAMP-binding protein